MEDVLQRTSSQTNAIDTMNNNNNNNNNNDAVKVRSPKPPLLPKPQIIKLDSGVLMAVKSSPSSSGLISSPSPSENGTTAVQSLTSADSGGSNSSRPARKPPLISPKPRVPAKIVTLTNGSGLGVSPQQQQHPHQQRPRSPPLYESTPVRPSTHEDPRLPPAGGDSSVKQKSASLDRSEDLSWTLLDAFDKSEELLEFCKQVEMCSRHSHLLKSDSGSSPHAWRSQLNELDSASGNVDRVVAGTGDGLKVAPDVVNGVQDNCTNGYATDKSIDLVDNPNSSSSSSSKKSSNVCSSSESPKSFLHRYVNFNSQTQAKDSAVSSEKSPEKAVSVHSFLHRGRNQGSFKWTKSKSVDKSGSATATSSPSGISRQNSMQESGKDRDLTLDTKEQSLKIEVTKKSESPGADGTPFSKRFPWFGSFGKGGHKKEGGKKGRCVSQFYSSPDVDGETFREKTRTKSLPDIKHTRIASDGSFTLKPPATPTNSTTSNLTSDYPHSDSDDDKDSLNQVEMNSDKDCQTRAFRKANELMTSEEVFIDVLKLLNVDFRNYVQLKNFESRNTCIPSGEVNKILNHLSQLQSLNEDILDDLRKRIENWESNPKISDVIVKKGAFLKMYTTYIQNFEMQTNYLDECIVKYPKFGKIVREFESSDRCKKLTLKHYMLKPVQRIPQYRLLLNDYLKHLDESSPDYADTQTALKIVCEVVEHANRNLAHGDKEGRLMHFQSILTDYVLIKPGRDLVKDGPLEKICRKSVKDRYFILLNDCLLHTTYSKQYLKIHQELPLTGMKVCYNDDEKYPHSFTVHSIKRSFILCAKTESECRVWVEKLQQTIEEHISKQRTFLNVRIEMSDSFKLGKEAPVWVPDGKVTMCQLCTAEFTALFRRHHCRGCGKVICRNCGSNQAPLQYRNFKSDRVCDQCFELLLKDYDECEDSICDALKELFNLTGDDAVQNEYLTVKAKFVKYSPANSLKKPKYIPPRLKEVSANDSESTINGWLHRKSQKKPWKMFWYVLKDHVLYVYKASEDVLALETIPVLGYEVKRIQESIDDFDEKLMFSLVHKSQPRLLFRAESQSSADRWFEALTSASNFESLGV